MGHRNEVFLKLISLIEQYYMQERGVEFYADKLCLSPKYLSVICKSICGYTVKDLVSKSIIRKSISLLKNTQKNIQEIADMFNFPNASFLELSSKSKWACLLDNIARTSLFNSPSLWLRSV